VEVLSPLNVFRVDNNLGSDKPDSPSFVKNMSRIKNEFCKSLNIDISLFSEKILFAMKTLILWITMILRKNCSLLEAGLVLLLGVNRV
jgi:hypothetical protein